MIETVMSVMAVVWAIRNDPQATLAASLCLSWFLVSFMPVYA